MFQADSLTKGFSYWDRLKKKGTKKKQTPSLLIMLYLICADSVMNLCLAKGFNQMLYMCISSIYAATLNFSPLLHSHTYRCSKHKYRNGFSFKHVWTSFACYPVNTHIFPSNIETFHHMMLLNSCPSNAGHDLYWRL